MFTKCLRSIAAVLSAYALIFCCSALFFNASVLAANEETVALVMKALTNPFFSKMELGAKAYANRSKIPLEVFGVERETDVERQISIMENLISRGYGAIVIAPVDSKQLVPVCRKALASGIVVINIDNPLHKATLRKYNLTIPFVGPDNRAGAAQVGVYVRNRLNGHGRVIVIEGIRGVENAELRKTGFIEAITQDSSIEIVASESANWHTDEALSLAVKLLSTHAPVDAVFCANDKMALGVLQALDISGLAGKTVLAGYDNIDAVRSEMQSGRMHATVEQHPELMGQYGVELAVNALEGKKLPLHQPTPVDLVTYETFGKTIALSISSLLNPFFITLHQAVLDAALLHGVKLVVADARDNNAQQLIDLSSFLNERIDALIVNPTNSETVGPGIELANNLNIPVITVDRKASEGQTICHIESDNVEGGRMAASLIARLLKGKGRVIELEGIPGTSAALDRGAGFNEALKAYPDIKVVAREVADFEQQKAKEVVLRTMQRNVLFDGVFAHNDNMILGAAEALEARGASSALVLVGFDGIQAAREALRQGRINATIAQKPEKMGALAVSSIVRFWRGEKPVSPIRVELEVIEK
ncbi:MAG: substrate-binding domain-containing protein [Desulfobacterales bacterium]|jgi:ABC-type sugar transport system substrate-binding protein